MGGVLGVFLGLLLWVAPAAAESRFRAVELEVDSGSAVLAAYQVEVLYDPAAVSLVGIEGGDEPFAAPPYYDPRGLTAGRVVIAAFTVGARPVSGGGRVARLHLEERAEVAEPLALRILAAGDPEGRRIEAQARLVPFVYAEGGAR